MKQNEIFAAVVQLWLLQAAGEFFTSYQDVMVPNSDPEPLAALAIQKGVTLQRYVETCRACLGHADEVITEHEDNGRV